MARHTGGTKSAKRLKEMVEHRKQHLISRGWPADEAQKWAMQMVHGGDMITMAFDKSVEQGHAERKKRMREVIAGIGNALATKRSK